MSEPADPRDPYRMLAAVVAAVEADADVETLLDPDLDLNVLRNEVESDPTADALLDTDPNGPRSTSRAPEPVIELQGDTVVIDLRDRLTPATPTTPATPALDEPAEPVVTAAEPVVAPAVEVRHEPVTRRRPPGPDAALSVVLNRARYRSLGLEAVATVDSDGAALAELAALCGRTPTPGVTELIRQAVEARSV